MVPLRFISENFGATVSYDETTEAITVIKENSAGQGTIVEGITESKYIGDSYYGWSMETPSDMQMETRYFDGTYTSFVYDENNWIDIGVYAHDEAFDFDSEFTEWKSSMQGLTLSKADKDVSNPSQKRMHLQSKDKSTIYDVYVIETTDYIMEAYGEFELSNESISGKGIGYLASFDIKFTPDETYDLSNVKDGMRRFNAETMKMSFDVPQEFIMTSDEEAVNSFYFCNINPDDDASSISVSIYSKDSVDSAEALANTDYALNKRYVNEKISVFSESVTKNVYNNLEAYEYTNEIDGKSTKEYSRDVFFEKGEYVYNIHVSVQLPSSDKHAFADRILNSVEIETVDFSKVGTIIRNDGYEEGSFTSDDLNKCKLQIPSIYQKIQASDGIVVYSTGSIIFAGSAITGAESYQNIKSAIKQLETQRSKQKGVKITEAVKDVTIGKTKFAKMSYSFELEGDFGYYETYATYKNGIAYIFEITYDEIVYSQYSKQEIQNILSSITFE